MKPNEQVLRFLLGANTPQGFVSRFEGIASVEDGWRLLVIKGGPGSGKSTMMKRIAAALEPQYENIEYIHCSSDADSLDGVVVPGLKFAIIDGTPPQGVVFKIIKWVITTNNRTGRFTHRNGSCFRRDAKSKKHAAAAPVMRHHVASTGSNIQENNHFP